MVQSACRRAGMLAELTEGGSLAYWPLATDEVLTPKSTLGTRLLLLLAGAEQRRRAPTMAPRHSVVVW